MLLTKSCEICMCSANHKVVITSATTIALECQVCYYICAERTCYDLPTHVPPMPQYAASSCLTTDDKAAKLAAVKARKVMPSKWYLYTPGYDDEWFAAINGARTNTNDVLVAFLNMIAAESNSWEGERARTTLMALALPVPERTNL